MNSTTHEIEREEVMAYLDGELEPARATAVAAHVERCTECAALTTQLRGVSQHLSHWQVEPPSSQFEEQVLTGIEAQVPAPAPVRSGLSPRFRFVWTPSFFPRWVWLTTGSLAVLSIIAAIIVPGALRKGRFEGAVGYVDLAPSSSPKDIYPPVNRQSGAGGSTQPRNMNGDVTFGSANGQFAFNLKSQESKAPDRLTGPMVIRTATLVLVTKEFDQARAAIERVVKQRGGHFGQLTVSGQTGSARSLEATARIPSAQLDAAMAELKKLARVEQESQQGEEVTQQYVDLVARLTNSRHTEQRLIEVLRTRTGKVGDVLEVEREIARVREEIESAEAQRKTMANQVEFATLQLRMNEDYRAGLQVTPPSTVSRLWNALVEGVQNAAQSVLSLVFFLLTVLPTLLLWTALLAWPARVAWRRIAAHMAAVTATTA